MAVEGPIEELSLADLLQLLSLTRKMGLLRVVGKGGEEVGRIYLKDGDVAFASLIDKEKSPQEGAVSESERVSRPKVEDAVHHLCGLARGHFRFEEGPLPAELRPVFSLKTQELIMEWTRKADEWSRIEERIPSPEVILEVAPEGPKDLDLKPEEWRLLYLADGNRTVREIIEQMGDESEATRAIYRLVSSGVLNVLEEADEVQDHLSRGKEFLRKGFYGKATEEFELALDKDPNNPEILLSSGEALYQKGSYREALSTYGKLQALESDNPDAYYHSGFCLVRLGDLKQAISVWETFLSLSSADDYKREVNNLLKLARMLEDLLQKRAGPAS